MTTVSWDDKSLKVDGKPIFILSGELHYFRIPRELWEDRILKAKRAFLNAVSTYFAWNWHERGEGCFDFSEWRDVDEFLSLCEKHGLYVIARPGPYICSEWDFGGLPNWLIGRNIVPRSLDKEFMKHALRYYDHIIPIIRKHLATRGGSVILFQIENEYFWGNVPYLLSLYEAVRERGINVPIVHNADRFLRGTQIIDSIDIYPDPWDLEGPEKQAESLIEEQPDKPKMIMEFEGGWFTSFGGKLPTDRGDIPVGWTDMLLKTVLFKGFSLINFYMFHGGTNFGYWTGKNITSTYDYQAAIREWGELGERYWAIRLVGALLESFNEIFASSTIDKTLVTCNDPSFQVSSIMHEKGGFILIANKTPKQDAATIHIKGLGEKSIRLNGRTALILPLNVKLENGWILEFSTCQILYSYELNGRTILIVYGDSGSQHEITLIRPFSGIRETVSFTIYEDDFFKLIGDSSSSLLLVALSRERAARTWFAEYLGKKIAVISSFDLLRSYFTEEDGLRMSIDFKKGDGRLVRVIVPWKPKAIKVDGRRIEGTYDDEKWVLSVILPDFEFQEDTLSLEEDWKYAIEDLKRVKLGSWIRVQGLPPLESLGITGNGHIWYFNKFRFEKKTKRNKIVLFIPRVNDYISVFLNRRFLGYAKHTARFEVEEKVLEDGDNELLLLVESTGHRNDGILPVGNGLNEPVFIGEEESIPMKNPYFKVLKEESFLKPGLPAALDYSRFVNRPTEILPPECFSEGWREFKNHEEIAGQKGIFLFKYNVNIPETDKKICVVLPPGLSGWGRAMLFVNGRHAGTVPVDEGQVGINVTPLVKQGVENEFVFLLENMPSAPAWSNPCARLYDIILDNGWRVSQGLLGEKEGWFKPEFNDSDWKQIRLRDALDKGRVTWLRRRFFYKPNENTVSPLMLRLDSMGTKCKIYLNGELIGRYMKTGPQRDFYMPEPLLRKENTLAIVVENYDDPSEAPSIHILPYYFAKKAELKISF
ncbi:MAG: beta-galactosidase [Candidatus Brockarchaeota archaeon]|nr:beta-galactosidase [Candidatus Brockarchaeota archaeon]